MKLNEKLYNYHVITNISIDSVISLVNKGWVKTYSGRTVGGFDSYE